MGGLMVHLVNIVSGILGVYILLLCIRIFLTWFSGMAFGGPMVFLQSICDPYLNWFRRFRFLRKGPMDFSPLAALAVLSLVRGILGTWGAQGRISLALVLAMIISALWSIVSWVLGFCIIVLILRLIAFAGNVNIYSPFWRLVDFIAEPILYNICRIIFPMRIVSYLPRIIVSIVALVLVFAALWIAAGLGTMLLQFMPI